MPAIKPKILIAGMNKFPNQFSRYIEKMGCETVRLSGDAGGSIPTNCEAVIITKCQVSHDKFWRVKDEFKKVNKPVFITDYGISPIKERLEAFIAKLPKNVPLKREDMPVANVVKKNVAPPKKAPPQNSEANKVIVECFNAGFSIKETLQMVADLKDPEGNPYGVTYITTLWSQLGFKPRKAAAKPVKPKPIAEEPPSIFLAIADIIHRPISKNEKAQLIQRVLNREPLEMVIEVRREDQSLSFIAGKESILVLTKEQASTILKHLAKVQEFADSTDK